MPGPRMKIGTLIELMLESIGQRGNKDVRELWFEYVYGIIRETPFSWNFTHTSGIGRVPFVTVEKFTWAAGTSYLVSAATPTFPYTYTGRYVVIDDIAYRIVAIDFLLKRIYVDGIIHVTNTTPVEVTLYRIDLGLKTSHIKDVSFNKIKINSMNIDNATRFNRFHRNYLPRESGESLLYYCDDSAQIPHPLFPPSVNTKVNPGNIEAGDYKYFFTFFDPESGSESPPGPELTVSDINTFQATFAYYNPDDPNRTEFPTYQLRLWRSMKNPGTERYPAYLVGTKDPKDNSAYVADNLEDVRRRTKERYYDGHRTVIEFHPFPDAEYAIDVLHTNDWGRRPDPDDMVDVGRGNSVLELLNIGAGIFTEQASRDQASMLNMTIKFKQQLAYIIRKSGDSNDADPGIDNTFKNDGLIGGGSNDIVESWTWKQ